MNRYIHEHGEDGDEGLHEDLVWQTRSACRIAYAVWSMSRGDRREDIASEDEQVLLALGEFPGVVAALVPLIVADEAKANGQ